jgi:predicted DNA-binding protein YlxM (UPF0122 family)
MLYKGKLVMQFEEFYEYTILFDIYGNLLSNKQRNVMDKFLNLDLGESELAELLGDSRQAVHDAIVKAKKQLIQMEDKCHIAENLFKAKQMLSNAKSFLKETDENQKKSIDIIDDVINLI